MMITSIISGNLVNKTGYRFWIILGILITVGGLLMFNQLTIGSELTYYAECLFVFGVGLGCMMSVIMVAVQNASKPSEIGMTTSATNLFRGIGTTVGTAVFAMIIGNKIDEELRDHVSNTVYGMISHDTGCLQDLFNAISSPTVENLPIINAANGILEAFANSVDYAFLCGAVIVAFLLIIAVIFKADVYKGSDMDEEITAHIQSDVDAYSKHGIMPKHFRQTEDGSIVAGESSETDSGKKHHFSRKKE